MSNQTLRDIIKWDSISQGKKQKLKDGSDAFHFSMVIDGNESFLVHVLFNHKTCGFNNIFKKPVPLLEVQSLYRQCLIDVNSSGRCLFTYRGIAFSLDIGTDPIWKVNKNGEFTYSGFIMIAGQFTE